MPPASIYPPQALASSDMLEELFKNLDLDGDGQVTLQEVQEVLRMIRANGECMGIDETKDPFKFLIEVRSRVRCRMHVVISHV